MSGVEGNQEGPNHLAQAPALVLLEQNQGHRFIPLQINLIPAINGARGTSFPSLSPLTVSWPCPQDHNEYNSSMARSQTNTARIEGLRPGMVYVVQVRARTVAGYGKYSGKMCFQTLTDGESGMGGTGRQKGVVVFPATASGFNWIKRTCLCKPLSQRAAWQKPGDLQRRLINRQLEE